MLQADTVHSQDDLICVDLAKIIDCKTTSHGIGMGLELAADQVMLKACFPQFECCINIIAEYCDALIAANKADDLSRGCAAINKHNIILIYKRGCQLTDQTLFFGIFLCPLQILGFQSQPLAEDRPPMCPFDNALAFQPFQIATHS